MKRVHRIGLVTAGKITGLWIEKTVELKRNVGPVYSTSLRLASRASNTLLRTGFHTTDWEELQRCEAVLFFLPAKSLQLMIADWINRGYDVRGLRLVLCDEELGLADLAHLRGLGAQIAAVGPLPHSEQSRFVGEGDALALAPVIRLLQADGLKFTRLNSGGKSRLREAVDRLHGDSLPMFANTVDALRDAGLAPDVAALLAEKCFSHALRLYARNGRRVCDARVPPLVASAPPPPPVDSAGDELLALESALVRGWKKDVPPKARAAAAGSPLESPGDNARMT